MVGLLAPFSNRGTARYHVIEHRRRPAVVIQERRRPGVVIETEGRSYR